MSWGPALTRRYETSRAEAVCRHSCNPSSLTSRPPGLESRAKRMTRPPTTARESKGCFGLRRHPLTFAWSGCTLLSGPHALLVFARAAPGTPMLRLKRAESNRLWPPISRFLCVTIKLKSSHPRHLCGLFFRRKRGLPRYTLDLHYHARRMPPLKNPKFPNHRCQPCQQTTRSLGVDLSFPSPRYPAASSSCSRKNQRENAQVAPVVCVHAHLYMQSALEVYRTAFLLFPANWRLIGWLWAVNYHECDMRCRPATHCCGTHKDKRGDLLAISRNESGRASPPTTPSRPLCRAHIIPSGAG
jgi:hypothetical protein